MKAINHCLPSEMKRKIFWMVMILISFSLNQFTLAQVTIDATSTGFATAGTTITVSHTTGSSDNRLMLVGISWREGDTISSVLYGDDALSRVGKNIVSANARTSIWYMLDPPTGSANVVVTRSGGNFSKGGIVGVMTFYGVDPNTPLNTYSSLYGNSTNPTLTGIPSNPDELVFNVVALQNQNLTGVGAGQTIQWNIPSGDEMRGGGSTKTGTSPTATMSWTSASDDWSMSAVSIIPIGEADLEINKTVDIPTPYIGQTISFTLTATNNGPDNVLNVYVNDLLPSGFVYQSHSASTGTYSGGSGEWSIGSFNSGSTATLTINAVVNATGIYTNTAVITGDAIDPVTTNNTASASITICQAGGTKPLFNN